MTVENRDVFVERPWMGEQRVTGSPVRERTAGDGLHRGRKLGQCRFATPKGKSVLFLKV
ncbi:MAG: hypothetical protein SLagBPW_03690 [Shewanella algae]